MENDKNQTNQGHIFEYGDYAGIRFYVLVNLWNYS
jgi:hypothetical protein